MNKHLAESDLATPKVTTGPITGSRKIYTAPEAAPDLKVPLREVARLSREVLALQGYSWPFAGMTRIRFKGFPHPRSQLLPELPSEHR